MGSVALAAGVAILSETYTVEDYLIPFLSRNVIRLDHKLPSV